MTAFDGVRLVCPQCRGELAEGLEEFSCSACQRRYPILCGIPDFRLEPDPYIAIEADREKGRLLWEYGNGRSYEEMLRHYYAITPEDPSDLAEQWAAHSLAEIDIAEAVLAGAGLIESRTPSVPEVRRESDATGITLPSLKGPARGGRGTLLDIGCSTGAMLLAARDRFSNLVGADVAFRWLVLGRIRLRETGVHATLICANAEHLPFATASVQTITATDLLEHVRSATRTAREAARVLVPGGRSVWTTNNRFAPVPEPHVRLWGVGWLPRAWQARYVLGRRRDLLPYAIRLRSAGELGRIFAGAGFARVQIEAAPLVAPHVSKPIVQTLLRWYNRGLKWPLLSALFRRVGPRLWVRAER